MAMSQLAGIVYLYNYAWKCRMFWVLTYSMAFLWKLLAPYIVFVLTFCCMASCPTSGGIYVGMSVYIIHKLRQYDCASIYIIM